VRSANSAGDIKFLQKILKRLDLRSLSVVILQRRIDKLESMFLVQADEIQRISEQLKAIDK
jgi:hypothetical protein